MKLPPLRTVPMSSGQRTVAASPVSAYTQQAENQEFCWISRSREVGIGLALTFRCTRDDKQMMTLQQTSSSKAGWFGAVVFLWVVLVVGGVLQTF